MGCVKVFTVEFTEPTPKDGREPPSFQTAEAFEKALVEALEFAGGPVMDYAVRVTKLREREPAWVV